MVEGWIRGTEIQDQQIVLVAHIQEEMTSANDERQRLCPTCWRSVGLSG